MNAIVPKHMTLELFLWDSQSSRWSWTQLDASQCVPIFTRWGIQKPLRLFPHLACRFLVYKLQH